MKLVSTFALLHVACFPFAQADSRSATHTNAAPAVDYVAEGFEKTSGDLEESVGKATHDYAVDGQAVKGELATFKQQAFKMKRGKCYVLVMRLGADAEFSTHARKGIGLLFTGVDTGIDSFNAGVVTNGGPGIIGPGGHATAGCPQADSNVTFDMQAIWGSAMDKSRIHDLGKGTYALQLYSKSVTEQELVTRKQGMQKSLDEGDAFQRRYEAEQAERTRNRCSECAQKKLECIADWRRNASRDRCESDYRFCGGLACR
jgi:hypothetical protein